MKSAFAKLALGVSNFVAWIISLITIGVALKYQYIAGYTMIEWYYNYIEKYDSLTYFILWSFILVMVVTVLVLMCCTIGFVWEQTCKYTEKYSKIYQDKIDKIKVIENKNKTRKEFSKLSDAEQTRIIGEMYQKDKKKRQDKIDAIINQKKKLLRDIEWEEKRRERELEQRRLEEQEEREEEIRWNNLTPEERYWEEKAEADEELREEMRNRAYQSDVYREDEYTRSCRENEAKRQQDSHNEAMLAEAKKANRNPVEKFYDMPWYDKATCIIVGDALLNRK